MTKISRLYSERPVSAEVNDALNALCEEAGQAIQRAKDAGVPQGLVVAIMAASFHEETARMLAIKSEIAGNTNK